MDATFQSLWENKDPFYDVELLTGTVYRELESRRTLRFSVMGKFYFAKIHRGVSWGHIISDLLRFRAPILGAVNEWLAIDKLHLAGVPTMKVAAYGWQNGYNPAARHSFLITHSLENTISLEDFGKSVLNSAGNRINPKIVKLKHRLIYEVSRMTRNMHQAGVNHRDYYLCHFLLHCPSEPDALDPEKIQLWLIDLHRSQIRNKVPRRWIIKDLAALYFSTLDLAMTRRDYFRFILEYTGLPLREALQQKNSVWPLLQSKAEKLYLRYKKKFAVN